MNSLFEVLSTDFSSELKEFSLTSLTDLDFQDALSLIDNVRLNKQFDGIELKAVAISMLLFQASGAMSLQRNFVKKLSFAATMQVMKDGNNSLYQSLKKFFPSCIVSGNGFAIHFLELSEFCNLQEFELENGFAVMSQEDAMVVLQTALQHKLKFKSVIREFPDSFQLNAKKLQYLEPESLQSRGGLKFLEVPCVKKALGGVREGRRWYGSMAIAIACLKDKLSKEKAVEIVNSYVVNCQKISSDFTDKEALSSLDWVYNRDSMGFSCNAIRSQGLADINADCIKCPLYKSSKRR